MDTKGRVLRKYQLVMQDLEAATFHFLNKVAADVGTQCGM